MNDLNTILCDFINEGKRWETLSAQDWLLVLGTDPYFVEKCDLVKGWNLFSGNCWVRLLTEYPKFKDICDKHKGWDKFYYWDWVELIKKQPKIADEKRHKITNFDNVWKHIVSTLKNPKSGYDFETGWCFFNAEEWLKLFKLDKSYVTKCTEFNCWGLLGVYELWELFKDYPDLVDVYPLWDSLDAEEWASLFEDFPQLVGKCDDVKGWVKFDKRLYDIQGHYGVTKETYWAYILSTHPEWSDRCDEFDGWNKFDQRDWVMLLKVQPQFADKFEIFNGLSKFESRHWIRLLQGQPQFSQQCDKVCGWKDFNGFDWVELLREQPIFSDKCDSFDGWRKIDFTATSCIRDDYMPGGKMCYAYKQYAIHGMTIDDSGKHVRVIRLGYREEGMSGDAFLTAVELGEQVQEDESECVYYGINNSIVARSETIPLFCGRWAELLERQPQFAAKCDEYNGWEIFDGFDWFRLLSAQPCFVEKCNKLNGWQKLFYYRPQECHYDDEEHGNIYVYSHEQLFEPPAEYEKDFERESILSANDCLNGAPVDCWLHRVKRTTAHDQLLFEESDHLFEEPDPLTCDVDALPESLARRDDKDEECLRYGQINLPEGEILILKSGLKTDFWVYLLNQDSVFAILLAAQYGLSEVWSTLTLDEWQIAIKERTCFINSLMDLDYKDCLDYNPRDDFFDEWFWNSLIAAWPGFFDGLGYWYKGSRYDYDRWVGCNAWPYLVRHRPEWAVYMKNKDWTRFEENDWIRLLDPYWQFLTKTTAVVDDCFWWNCLSTAPSLADICEQNHGWSKLSNNQLVDLMTVHDELTRFCLKYLNWDALTHDEWMRIIDKQPKYAREYVEKCTSSEDNKQTEAEIVRKAKEYIAQKTRKKCASSTRDDTWYDDYSDWRESSGWNDTYGRCLEPSDIIEFRD